MKPKIVVVGSANMDVVLRTPRVPGPGETVTGRSLTYTPGGKGANQAVAAARLGAEVAMVARVGSDPSGGAVRDNLLENGVDGRFVLAAEAPQGIAVILVDDAGQNCIVLAAGSNAQLTPEDVDAAGAAFAGASVLLLQNEVSQETTLRAARAGRAAGVTVVWNPAPAPEVEVAAAMAGSVDIIVPNESEAERLSGVPVCDLRSARVAADALRAQGFPTVVVTLGEKGALWVDAEGERHVPAVPVEVVDTTAAGDTFIGALGVALAEGRAPEEAMHFAARAAALSVTQLGAQSGMPTRERMENREWAIGSGQ